MIKLMKYEFRKTLAVKLLLLGLTAAVEVAYLLCLLLDREAGMALTVLLLSLLSFGGVMAIGLTSVFTLHRDLNTRQSYMLFMTPNSAYRILGAKVLENGLSIMLTGLCFFGLAALDVTLLFGHYHDLTALWEMILRLIRSLYAEISIDASMLLTITLNMLSNWISMVTTAYLAVTISAALLNGKRFNGLVSFALIIVLNWLTTWAQQTATIGIAEAQTAFLVQGAMALGFSALMYVGTAVLMERKLSV